MRLGRLLFLICLAAGGYWLLHTYVVETIYIASGSMEPTLRTGSSYFLDRTAYWFSKPAHGDVISFTMPVDGGRGAVKRVVAVGGDLVELKQKRVFLNGAELFEPYARYSRRGENLKGDNFGPARVPENDVFLLGDNRDESYDSLTWRNAAGEHVYFLPADKIEGKVRGAYPKLTAKQMEDADAGR